MLLYKNITMKIIIAFITIIILSQVCSAEIGKETGLEIPRYVSLKSNDANIRVGPSMNYPIVVKYIIKNYPLKVLEEYNEWRKVEDFKKNVGWIHKSLISGTRTGIILSKDNENIQLLNTLDGNVIGDGHAPGGDQGCTSDSVIVNPASPQSLNPGPHTLIINFTTNDELYHVDAYYEILLKLIVPR